MDTAKCPALKAKAWKLFCLSDSRTYTQSIAFLSHLWFYVRPFHPVIILIYSTAMSGMLTSCKHITDTWVSRWSKQHIKWRCVSLKVYAGGGDANGLSDLPKVKWTFPVGVDRKTTLLNGQIKIIYHAFPIQWTVHRLSSRILNLRSWTSASLKLNT